MRHSLTAAVLVMSCAAGATADLLACGDKFLVPARGTRFSTASLARHDASVLLYASDASDLFRTLNRLSIPATLQKAGYRPTVARNSADFTNALAQGSWDLVVVDPSDPPPVSDPASSASGPAILAVNHTLAGDQLKLARQQYPALVKAPRNSGAFLEMIDTALEKHRAKRAKTP